MADLNKTCDCYIGAVLKRSLDPFLEKNGFARGLISFAVPEFGILFKCCVEGEPVELEFAAFFSLLKFLTTTLAGEKIKSIRVFSSMPEFVFSFTGKGKYLAENSPKYKMLREYSSKMAIAISFIEKKNNRSLISPADYPSLPEGQAVKLDYDYYKKQKIKIKPLQKGIII
jgi:hypothetical protein